MPYPAGAEQVRAIYSQLHIRIQKYRWIYSVSKLIYFKVLSISRKYSIDNNSFTFCAFYCFEKVNLFPQILSAGCSANPPASCVPFDEDRSKYSVTRWQGLCSWCDMGLLDRPPCHFASVPMELPLSSSPALAADRKALCWLSPAAVCSGWPLLQGPRSAVAASTPAVVWPRAIYPEAKASPGPASSSSDSLPQQEKNDSSRYLLLFGNGLKHQPSIKPQHLYADKSSKPGFGFLPLNIPP